LYSPQTSLNGAKLLLNKGPAKRPTVEDMSDMVAAPAIIIPGVTRDGEFTSGLPNKRKRDKERQDPRKSRRPEMPVHGPGKGGRVGASATQHVVQNLVRDTTRDEDVRVLLFSFPVSAFCVSLRCPVVVVVSAVVWSDRADDCQGSSKHRPVYQFKEFLFTALVKEKEREGQWRGNENAHVRPRRL
jgi:hypothetical protein